MVSDLTPGQPSVFGFMFHVSLNPTDLLCSDSEANISNSCHIKLPAWLDTSRVKVRKCFSVTSERCLYKRQTKGNRWLHKVLIKKSKHVAVI